MKLKTYIPKISTILYDKNFQITILLVAIMVVIHTVDKYYNKDKEFRQQYSELWKIKNNLLIYDLTVYALLKFIWETIKVFIIFIMIHTFLIYSK